MVRPVGLLPPPSGKATWARNFRANQPTEKTPITNEGQVGKRPTSQEPAAPVVKPSVKPPKKVVAPKQFKMKNDRDIDWLENYINKWNKKYNFYEFSENQYMFKSKNNELLEVRTDNNWYITSKKILGELDSDWYLKTKNTKATPKKVVAPKKEAVKNPSNKNPNKPARMIEIENQMSDIEKRVKNIKEIPKWWDPEYKKTSGWAYRVQI